MKLIILLFSAVLLTQFCDCKSVASKEEKKDCVSPWQKVTDDICLLVSSVWKPWKQAKRICRMYHSELLFIQNESEQKTIEELISSITKYRFLDAPNIWLDALEQVTEGNWTWSKDNQTLNYTNWVPEFKSNPNNLNCGCIRTKDSFWKDCNCNSKQHYVCRRGERPLNLDVRMKILAPELTVPNEEDSTTTAETTETSTELTSTETTTDSPSTTSILEETPDMAYVSVKGEPKPEPKALSVQDEEKQLIISTKVLLDLEDKTAKSDIHKFDTGVELVKSGKPSLSMLRMKKRPSVSRTGPLVLRVDQVNKSDEAYSVYYCPRGLGFYSIPGTKCNKYKKCDEHKEATAQVTVNGCGGETPVFSFDALRCVSGAEYPCDDNVPEFVPFF